MDAHALHHRHSHFHRHAGLISRHAASLGEHEERSMAIPNRSIEERTPDKVLQARSSKTCSSSQGSDTCEKPVDTSGSLSIILGVVIPVVACIIVCIYLHRRYLARQRREDNDSKHKSLDFGMEIGRRLSRKGKKGQQKIPEMSVTDFEKSVRRGRGMSMDMDMSSPYLLPAALKGSRESIHSLSRSMKDSYDPYRPVTMVSNDNSSARYPRVRGGVDSASTLTGSSHGTDAFNAGLLKNAKSMSMSPPPRGDSMAFPRRETISPPPNGAAFSKETGLPSNPPPPPEPPVNAYHKNMGYRKETMSPPNASPDRDSYFDNNAQTFLTSDTYVPPPRSTSGRAPDTTQFPEQSRITSTTMPTLPQIDVQDHDYTGTYNDWAKHDQPASQNDEAYHMNGQIPQEQEPEPMPAQLHQPQPRNLGVNQPDYAAHRLSISVRPLPPDDPSEDAETRANRIRSFYKEYFDVSKPHHVGEVPPMPYQQDYYEDYGQEYLSMVQSSIPKAVNSSLPAGLTQSLSPAVL